SGAHPAGESGAHPAPEGATHPGRFMAAAAIADLGALAAIAAGVADALASGGRDVAEIGGTPWLFALAIALAAAGFALTLRLARDRIWLAVGGSVGWLALALFWLL
ncbi:MAG: hypothetical protein QOH13_2571, partial [Thermoleophilaceae bacterium]|nr:hypothetical protein [Thermoleophilaceae bacterium]